MTSKNVISENDRFVPLRWVFVSISIAIGSLGVAITSTFAVGTWTARISMGQAAVDQRISSIEGDRSRRIAQGEEFQKETIKALSRIETRLDLIMPKK